jgi:hypothetical protein
LLQSDAFAKEKDMLSSYPVALPKKIDQATMDRMENSYPGISEQIRRFDAAKFPACPSCASTDTASVQVGVTGRTINLSAATTKFHLRANGRPGDYFCTACKSYFNDTVA